MERNTGDLYRDLYGELTEFLPAALRDALAEMSNVEIVQTGNQIEIRPTSMLEDKDSVIRRLAEIDAELNRFLVDDPGNSISARNTGAKIVLTVRLETILNSHTERMQRRVTNRLRSRVE